jgi:hypothetical protein
VRKTAQTSHNQLEMNGVFIFAEKWTPFREKQWGNKEKYTVVICLFAQQEKADHRFRL